MTDLVHEGGTLGEPTGRQGLGPGAGWQVQWATGGRITGLVEAATGHADWVRSATTTVVGGRAVAVTGADDGAVLLWDLTTGERIGAAPRARGPVWTVETETETETVEGRGRLLASLTGGAEAAATCVVNGRPVVLLGRQNAPRLSMWDPATGLLVADVVGDLVNAPPVGRIGAVVAVAPAVVDAGHTEAVTLHDDSTVRAWNLTDRLYLGRVAPPTGGDGQRVSLTVVVVDGRLIAVTGAWDGRVQMWDVATRTEVTGREPLTGHTGPVWALTATVVDHRPLVATGGDDRTVRVWDMAAHRRLGSDLVFPSEVTTMTMAPDGRLLVGFGNDIAVLCRVFSSPARGPAWWRRRPRAR